MAFPIDRYLLPEPPGSVPEGFTGVRDPLLTGLPHRVDLGPSVNAVLVLPTGLAVQWLAADPLDVVSTSDEDRAAREPGAPAAPGLAESAPLRLVVRRQAEIVGTVPMAAGLRRVCGPVEVVVLGWSLRAGTVRGAGDFGSYVELGWRRADEAVDVYGPPPVHRFVLRRRPVRIESERLLRREYWLLADKKLRRRLPR